MSTEVVTFLGDVHGDLNALVSLLRKINGPVIQVGDLGIFTQEDADAVKLISDHHPDFQALRGNHDNPWLFDLPNLLGTWGPINERVFYIAGASSIDRQWRTPGLDWWPEEQLGLDELDQAVRDYTQHEPSIMVTHDAPEFLLSTLISFNTMSGSNAFAGVTDNSATRAALNECYEVHQPDLWIFGHWHRHFQVTLSKTTFVCLPCIGMPNSTYQIPLRTFEHGF